MPRLLLSLLILKSSLLLSNKVDSTFINKAEYFEQINIIDSALIYYEKAINQFKQQKDTVNTFKFLAKKISIQSTLKGDFRAALKALNEIKLYYDTSNLTNHYFVLQYYSLVYGKLNLMEKSTEYLLELYKISVQKNDTCDMVACLTNIAINGFISNRNEFVIARFNQALELTNKTNQCNDKTSIYFNMASFYLNSNEIDSAFKYNSLSLKNITPENSSFLPRINLLFAEYFTKKNNVDSAKKYIEKVYLNSNENLYLKIYAKELEYKLHEKLNNLKAAEESAKECIRLAQKDSLGSFIVDASSFLKELALKENDYKKAFEFQQLESFYSKKILEENEAQKIEVLHIEMNERVFETENTFLKKEVESQFTIIEKEQSLNKLKNIFILFLIFFSIICVFLLVMLKKQKEKKEKVTIKMLESIQSNNNILKTNLLQNQSLIKEKNDIINSLKEQFENKEAFDNLINSITNDKDWLGFIKNFELLYNVNFESKRLSFPDINQTDIRVICLIKLGLTNKEMASYINITENGIKKAIQRVRKKLNAQAEEKSIDIVDDFLK